MNDEGNLRKQRRKRVLKEGQLITEDMTSLVNVKIRDLSETGARVETAGIIDLPEHFKLFVVSEKAVYSCLARWRRGNLLGIEFTGPPRTSVLRKF